ncbi:MAG: hypothetical protein LBQ73_08475, partial [Tannerellaceae bacterium]|nr:hypothetical protein [Tannerellaceae bacterium]
DDCDYLVGADNFWRHFTFPGGHGSLYPIILSPLVGLWGMKLLLFKSLSAVFIVLSIWLLYKTFRGLVPAVVLTPALLLASICSYIFFYASHTYSEPLFMLIQGLFLYFFARYFLGKDDVSYCLKADWRKYLVIGGLALCLTLTRTIGYSVLGVVVLFLAIRRRWKDLLYMLGAFILVFGLFQLFKSIAWPGVGGSYSFQTLLAKDPYNPALGQEDLPGLLKRYVENSHVYLSAFLYQFMGLIPETPSNFFSLSPIRTLAVYLLYAGCLVLVFKRNKALLFIGLYAGIMNFTSFTVLQSFWAQDRLIMIYYPLILLFLLGGIYCLFQIKALQRFFFIYPLLLLAICIGTLSITKNRVERNIPVLRQNLRGDRLYGLTPDWVNFIKGSQWAAKNLDKDARIVSRKPSISKVYTGRDFIVTPTVLPVPIDTLDFLKNTDDRSIVVIDASTGVFQGDAMRYLVRCMRESHLTINGVKSNTIGVYAIPNEQIEEMVSLLNTHQINYTLDYKGFVEQCKSVGSIRLYDPDMLLRYLQDNRINYLLLPKLRAADLTKNTGEYINDVHRYVWYVSYKYPDSFRTVHTIGEDETCEIVEFIK